MRERWALALKGSVIAVAVFFILQGRPPSVAQQQRMVPAEASPLTQSIEDALQDKDLSNLSAAILLQHAEIEKLKETQNTQANSITALDTNWKAAMSFIALLQAGGMFLSFRRKTV